MIDGTKWSKEAARPTQVIAGALLGLASLPFLLALPFALIAPVIEPEKFPPLTAFVGLVMAGALSVPGLLLSRRLITGKRRPDGGLVPSWMVALFGALVAAQGVVLYARHETDSDGLMALLEVAAGAVVLVRRRWRKARS